jgi:hypothetical protein
MQINPQMDHVAAGRTRYLFRNPPALSKPEEIETFVDGLSEIIPRKLSEVKARMTALELDRRERLDHIAEVCAKEYISGLTWWYATFSVESDFAEHHVLKKWLRYWTLLDGRLHPEAADNPPEGFTDAQIARARQVPIQELYSGELRRIGNRLTGLCPFHEEHTPSFSVFEDNNHFKCFGCGEQGDSIDFLMKLNNIPFRQAMNELLN